MSFKDDVMFYLSKGKVLNGVNIYENDDEDEQEIDKEEEKDTKKKKCPKCGKEKCECDDAEEADDDSEEDDEEPKAAVKDAKTQEAVRRVIKMKAKARGKGPAPDFGSTPEEARMYLDAEIDKKNKKNSSCKCADENPEDAVCRKKSKKSISTKTVADDDDDNYHPKASVATMREEILAYVK